MFRRALVLVLCLACLLPISMVAQEPGVHAAAAGKKVCKMVTRKVHGKKKRVKVCHNTKRHPTATPRPTNTPTPTATPSPTATATTVPANPLKVTPHPDGSKAASATITTDGGSISTTASDGATFTLTIPAGALLSPEKVTLTPLTGMDGLPLSGGLLGAAQLEPDGLMLAKPATLTIAPAHGASVGSPVSFAADGDGSEFHLYPERTSGSQVTLTIYHFSIHGVGSGTAVDVAGQLQRTPTSADDAAQQTAAARDMAASAPSQLSVAELEAATDTWAMTQYRNVVLPHMQAATTNDVIAAQSMQEALTWMHNIAVLGAEDAYESYFQTLFQLFGQALDNAYAGAAARCQKSHDVGEVIQLLSFSRIDAALGMGEAPDPEAHSRDVASCVHFALDVEAKLHNDTVVDPSRCGQNCAASGALSQHIDMDVKVTGLQLQLKSPLGSVSGQAQPVYATWNDTFITFFWSNGAMRETCTMHSSGTSAGSPMQATLMIDFNPRRVNGQPQPPAITLSIDPGTPTEILTGQQEQGHGCVDATVNETFYQNLMSTLGTTPPYKPPFLVNDWSYVGGAIWATTSVPFANSQTVNGANSTTTVNASGSVDLTLRHTPGP